MPLGVLSDIADLRETAARKALKKARSQVIDLRACLTALEAAVQALHEAVAPVSSLAAAEEQESVLKGSPVFTALPLSSIAMLMRRIYDMHEAELKVKRAMVADCEVALTEAQWRHGDSGGLPVGAVSNGKHSIGTSRLKDHESLEAFLQVHIVAWMLCVEVTEKQVEADLAMITQDANSC